VNYLTVTYPQTASILFEGQQYRNLQQVYLSSGNIVFPSLCAVSIGTTNPSALTEFPSFSGYQLPQNYFYTTDDNHLYVTVPSFSAIGTFDIIIFNVAGYDSLSKRGLLIKKN
jgi:hypothetical protein